VTVKNIGNLPAAINSIVASADFVVSNNTCTLTLAPGLTCFADVALRPVGFGPRTGSLFVNSNATGSPNVVGLGGTGCRPFNPSSPRFGVNTSGPCAP
jgi:secreted trypsin-like serine protease